MVSDEGSVTVRVNDQGRIVLPAQLRAHAGIRPGDTLIAWVNEEGQVVLSSRQALIDRMRLRYRGARDGSSSLVDELIEDRRQEAREDATSG